LSTAASEADTTRGGLVFVLLVALAVRLWNVAAHTYLMAPDETFQYLEPAHRLAFGSGIITWEYIYGIRSWLLPGVIAGVMRLASLVDPDPAGYVIPLRLLCVLASLSVPFVGFQMAARRFGLPTAILTGLLCALAYQAVYFSSVIMTEPLVADLSLLGIWLGDGTHEQPPKPRRLLLAGLLFGLAASLRYQYAPVLGAVVLLQHARNRRSLVLVAAGGLAVVMLAVGVLDAITLGAPFRSVWLNYKFNAREGVSSAMGTESWFYYLVYYPIAWGAITPVLLVGVVFGAMSAPMLGIAVVSTIGLHSMVPHKELRFVFLATACLPMLAGIGLGNMLNRVRRFRQITFGVPVAVVLAVAISGYAAIVTYHRASPPDDWSRDQSMLQALSAARSFPNACGLAIRTIWVYRSGGYSYWHRDLPIYFETWGDAQKLERSDFRLPLENMLDGRLVPQYPGALLAANAGKFNVIVGTGNDGLPGFSKQSCYGSGSLGDTVYCMFARPGGCD